MKLKSQKATTEQNQGSKSQAKIGEPSEENEFDDYEQEFADEYEEEIEEGIKVSSSDIEPVSQWYL